MTNDQPVSNKSEEIPFPPEHMRSTLARFRQLSFLFCFFLNSSEIKTCKLCHRITTNTKEEEVEVLNQIGGNANPIDPAVAILLLTLWRRWFWGHISNSYKTERDTELYVASLKHINYKHEHYNKHAVLNTFYEVR